jgi:hypothetical protein
VSEPTNAFSAGVKQVQAAFRDSPFAKKRAKGDEEGAVAEMKKNRRINAKTATAGNRGGSDIGFATGRPRDPLFYWKQNNLPYEFGDDRELSKVRQFTRLLYQTDPIIGSCVDIYSKLPLLGMELSCKDEKLTEFYTNLFGFGKDADDDSLNYKAFLIKMGREYWTVGEAWPFATFNETLGVWEDEELLQPDDIKVERSPFLKEPRYFIKLPETIRKVLRTRQPVWEYTKLVQAYPELVAYSADDMHMPVSGVLLRQLKFEGDTFNVRGVPLLTRAMRAVMQQEMLNAAMDAIADRMYTPLILVKLGASASDLGTQSPWIPTEDDLADFEEAMDAALAADFRALIYNFAVEMEPVFGREQMPDLTPDFERIEDRILQTFGLSRTLLTGASAGETYAADALNRDLISQLLTTYQDLIKAHYRQRALVVAEAQEHFDYDVRNGKRYVKMEEILEIDEETGEARIVEQPKLLIPELHMKCLALGTEVQTPSGPVPTETLKVGDEVLAWDEQAGVLTISPVLVSQDNGVERTYEIRTRLGRIIRATEEHPFLTADGWQKAMHLAPGAQLRIGTGFTPPAQSAMDAEEAYFFGLMTGDGGMTGRAPHLSTADSEIIEWVGDYVTPYGCKMTKISETGVDYRLCQPTGIKTRNQIKDRLRDVSMWGVLGHDKRIPAAIWAGGEDAWRAFLSGYLDADGTVWKKRSVVSWTSASRGLLKDVQTMLALLGVRSALDAQRKGISWQLAVTSKIGLAALQTVLTPRVERKADFLNWDVSYGSGARGLNRRVTMEWDEVMEIRECEPEPTWALTIAEHHTHVTEGLVTHNTMNLADEEQEREFLEALRTSGVPISMKTRTRNLPIELDEEVEQSQEEAIQLAVGEQETRKRTYMALRDQGLPIPPDLEADFGPKVAQAQLPTSMPSMIPQLGQAPQPVPTPNLAPVPQDFEEDPQDESSTAVPQQPMPGQTPDDDSQRPDESDEQRDGMPTAAKLFRQSERMRSLAVRAPALELDKDEEGNLVYTGELTHEPTGKWAAPGHIGKRRDLGLKPDEEMEELYG